MAMSNLSSGKRLIVLGGGVSGLSFVHYFRNFAAALDKNGQLGSITLLESNNYMGGSIKSKVFDDGIIHELGPRSVRTSGVRAQNTLVLLEQLGLADKVLFPTQESASKLKYIYTNNQLIQAPMSLGKLFTKLPGTKGTLASAIYRDMFKAEKMKLDDYPYGDPPLFDFIKHRFGEEMADSLCDPVMRGITAGDARKLSTRALFGEFLEKEQAYGSVLRGNSKPPVTKIPHDELFPNDIIESKLIDKIEKMKCGTYNLTSGLQTLPEHLSNSLLNTNTDSLISIYNETRAESIEFNNEDPDKAPCTVMVRTVDGDQLKLEADFLVSAIPSKELARLLPQSMPSEQREALENVIQIPHSPVGCVCVEYRDLKRPLPKIMESFGFLTHSRAGSRLLGIAFDSAQFPTIDAEHNAFRMTCMIGGSWFKEVLGTDDVDQVKDSQLEQIALEEIREILKIKDEPKRVSTLLWKTGIAQYTPGHKERLTASRDQIKKLSMPLTLIGQSYDGVAVNDVIFASRRAAYEFVKAL